jgi:inosine/xanthosine triphosphatase
LSVPSESESLVGVRRVRVGTANPPKLEAVRLAVRAYSPAAEVEGVAVESGVPEQPVGFDEILRGARNRAGAAGASAACDLSVGIEDGLVELPGLGSGPVLNMGCVIVTDGKREGMGISSAFAYPPACVAPAFEAREPIGELFDAYWREQRAGSPSPNSAPSAISSGNVGKLSLGVLNRSEYARHAVLCALIPFLHPDLYRELPTR